MCNLVNACMKNSVGLPSQPVPNLKVSHIHPVPTFYSVHKAKPLRMYTLVSRLSKFDFAYCSLKIVNLHSRRCNYPFKALLPHLTLAIYHSRRQQLFKIEYFSFEMGDFFFRDGDSLFEILFDFSSRYDLLFEMAYFLFEISNFLFKSRLFIRDWQFLFELENSGHLQLSSNSNNVPMTHILMVVEPHTTTDHILLTHSK